MRQHSRLLTAIILHSIPLTVDRVFLQLPGGRFRTEGSLMNQQRLAKCVQFKVCILHQLTNCLCWLQKSRGSPILVENTSKKCLIVAGGMRLFLVDDSQNPSWLQRGKNRAASCQVALKILPCTE